jgi:hypothetical protein
MCYSNSRNWKLFTKDDKKVPGLIKLGLGREEKLK